MAYNKAREEKKWHLWKDAEEKELRRLGVGENVIKRLHEADWKDFKTERRFYEHSVDTDTYIDKQAADETFADIQSVQNLLDEIDNEELYRLLQSADKLTLQIAIWKMAGYTSAEISQKTGLSLSVVKVRVWRLKKRIKNIL